MARLLNAGAEGKEGAVAVTPIDLFNFAVSNTQVRSGSWAYAPPGGITANTSIVGATARSYFLRVYVFIPSALSSTVQFQILQSIQGYEARIAADRTVGLFASNAGTQIGSSSAALSLSTWHRIEVRAKINTGAADEAELLVNGVQIAVTTTGSETDTAPDRINIANNSSNPTIYLDDIAFNDDTGASQNSWPGDGKLVLALPISDNAVGTGWTLGTGTAISSNGWSAVDNTPPLGVANVGAGSDQWQIHNATSAANSNYDANLKTYTNLGIGPLDTINVLIPIIATGAAVVTSAKQGTVGISSNPVIANIALKTDGAFWSGATEAAYPSGWKISYGTVTYNPTVTLGNSPVMRITQVTSSTRTANVCFMGMYVDYTPAAVVAALAEPPFIVPQAVKRSSFY
jgi:hypothetical protein